MGLQDLSNAERPTRRRADGAQHPMAKKFFQRMTDQAKRYNFLRMTYDNLRESPVNEPRMEVTDREEATEFVKNLILEMGADVVGIADFDPSLTFDSVEQLGHKHVIVFGMTMAYDAMVEIGPDSQTEVHRVYYSLDEMGVRLAHQIGAFGYSARMQPNGGDIPLPAYGQLAGIGELGKHGSLISPDLGSSFRLCAVSTDMPLISDGPKDFGIDEICANCNVCERFCPGDAIKPDKQTKAGVTRWYVDTPACEPYFFKLYGCKICLMVCPFNGRGALKDQFKPVAKVIRDAKDADGLMAVIREKTNFKEDEFEDIPEQQA